MLSEPVWHNAARRKEHLRLKKDCKLSGCNRMHPTYRGRVNALLLASFLMHCPEMHDKEKCSISLL